jgi:hypothetical protein
MVAHTCYPSYLGGRDQEDHSSKPAWVNSLWDPILKNPITKNRAGGVAQSEGRVQAPVLKQKKWLECNYSLSKASVYIQLCKAKYTSLSDSLGMLWSFFLF